MRISLPDRFPAIHIQVVLATILADASEEPILGGNNIVPCAGFTMEAVRELVLPSLPPRHGTDFSQLFSDIVLLAVLATILNVFVR